MATMEHTYLKEEELVRKAIKALIRELGPVEAIRFLNLPRERKVDSVQRHHEWQRTLDKDAFFDEVFS